MCKCAYFPKLVIFVSDMQHLAYGTGFHSYGVFSKISGQEPGPSYNEISMFWTQTWSLLMRNGFMKNIWTDLGSLFSSSEITHWLWYSVPATPWPVIIP